MLFKMLDAYEGSLKNLKEKRAKAFYEVDKKSVDELDQLIASTKKKIEQLERQIDGE